MRSEPAPALAPSRDADAPPRVDQDDLWASLHDAHLLALAADLPMPESVVHKPRRGRWLSRRDMRAAALSEHAWPKDDNRNEAYEWLAREKDRLNARLDEPYDWYEGRTAILD